MVFLYVHRIECAVRIEVVGASWAEAFVSVTTLVRCAIRRPGDFRLLELLRRARMGSFAARRCRRGDRRLSIPSMSVA